MAELPRPSDGDWPPREAFRDCEVELVDQPVGVRFYMEAESFSDALEDLNRLEFVELRTRGAGPNDGRRMAVHHTRIVGLYDPDWELLPEGRPPGDGGP